MSKTTQRQESAFAEGRTMGRELLRLRKEKRPSLSSLNPFMRNNNLRQVFHAGLKAGLNHKTEK